MKTTTLKTIARASAAVLALLAAQAHAQTATYDPLTKVLRVPSIQVGNEVYPNLVYRADSGAVLSIGNSANIAAIASSCTADLLTQAKYNALTPGMTMEQVVAMMGCLSDQKLDVRTPLFSAFTWIANNGKLITVYFDALALGVAPLNGIANFKQALGL